MSRRFQLLLSAGRNPGGRATPAKLVGERRRREASLARRLAAEICVEITG